MCPRPWVFQVLALALGVRELPERHEGAHELGVGSGHGHVVAGDARGHVGDLGVHRGVAEDQAAARQEHLVEALLQGAVQRDLRGQDAHVLDAEVGGAARRAQRVGGLGELQLEHQVELRGQHLAALEEPYEGRRHQHFAVLPGRDLHGMASWVLPEALEAPLVVPLLWLQQGVQVAAPAILRDIVGSLPVGVELDPLDEAAGLDGAREQAVCVGVVVPDPEGDLHAFRINEIHAAGEGNPRHATGGGRERGEARRVILYVAPGLHVIHVRSGELVVQALRELIVHRLRDVLHPACFPL